MSDGTSGRIYRGRDAFGAFEVGGDDGTGTVILRTPGGRQVRMTLLCAENLSDRIARAAERGRRRAVPDV